VSGGVRAGDGADRRVTSASGFSLDITTRPESPILAEFFAGYDQAFILPDEKENLDGFRACLDLGHGAIRRRLLERHGPHVELVLVAREASAQQGKDAPAMIGGANFIAHPVGETLVVGNLNYIFVQPGARGQGRFRRLVAACEALMQTLFAPPLRRPLTFIELNDPMILSDADYRLDSEAAGVDQFDRIAIWARLGARIVDFPYVQPPLSAHQAPEEGLIYAVLGAAGETSLDPAILLAHLERFFGVSVLKGVDPWTVPVAAAQLQALADMAIRGEPVALLDPAPSIEMGRAARLSGAARPLDFRALMREMN